MRAAGALFLAALLALCGCYSYSTLGRARIIAKGRFQAFAAPEALGIASRSGGSIRPTVEAGLRYGLTDRVELGGKLSVLGVTLGPRVQLLRSREPSSGFDLAIAPAVAYTFADKLALEAPLLAGVNLGPHQIVVAPRLVYQMQLDVPGQEGPVSFLYAGASFGAALRVTERFTFLPEVSLLGEVHEDPGFSSNLARAAGIQGALGLLFDL